MADLSDTEAAVLGLLTFGEQSGYDLDKLAARSVGYFWRPAKSKIYAVLPRLVERGFAASSGVKQATRPDKQVYRLSDAGEAALREQIEGRRERARDQLAALEEIARTIDRDAEFFPYLTLLHGLEDARSTVAWADRALHELDVRARKAERA